MYRRSSLDSSPFDPGFWTAARALWLSPAQVSGFGLSAAGVSAIELRAFL
ncbi:hypothetical protein [Sorangium sp. So ce1078]